MNTKAKFSEFTAEEIALAMKNPYKVGDGVTVCGFTDCRAYTVIAVTEKTITIQRDRATLLNGVNSGEKDALKCSAGGFAANISGEQRYRIERDIEGEILVARMRRSPRKVSLQVKDYIERDGKLITHRLEPNFSVFGQRVQPGRCEYYDFNF